MQALPNPPSYVKGINGTPPFLVFDAPNDENIGLYLEVLKKYKVTVVVRACESTYDTKTFVENGIEVVVRISVEMEYPDGTAPPDSVLRHWRKVVNTVAKRMKQTGEKECIGVHCVAGLGRAAVLVAVALIENGMPPLTAVEHIRKTRMNAINTRQLAWLRTYSGKSGSCCIS